jgi:anti-sigma B factor antagonist
MRFFFHDDDRDVLVLSLDAQINAYGADDILAQLDRFTESGARLLIIDCSQLTYITSQGIGRLFRLHKRVWEKQGQVRLAAVSRVVARILEITRLDAVFHAHPTLEDALRSVKEALP